MFFPCLCQRPFKLPCFTCHTLAIHTPSATGGGPTRVLYLARLVLHTFQMPLPRALLAPVLDWLHFGHPDQAQAAQAQATSYTRRPSTGNQLHTQPKHRQPVVQVAQAQATSYIRSPSTGNQSYTQPKHNQPIMQAAQAQATIYARSQSTGNQLYTQPKHKNHL